jgi:hypothetical protein
MVGVGVSLGGKGVGVSVGGRAVGWAQADSHPRLRDKNKTRQQWWKMDLRENSAASDTEMLKSGQIAEVENHRLLYNRSITILAHPQ